jgi:hypothetical protein
MHTIIYVHTRSEIPTCELSSSQRDCITFTISDPDEDHYTAHDTIIFFQNHKTKKLFLEQLRCQLNKEMAND